VNSESVAASDLRHRRRPARDPSKTFSAHTKRVFTHVQAIGKSGIYEPAAGCRHLGYA
jgi:hypothetical protein